MIYKRRQFSSTISTLLARPRSSGVWLQQNLSSTRSYRYSTSSTQPNNETSAGSDVELSLVVQPAHNIENRDLFHSILSVYSTKREAKSYLSHFSDTKSSVPAQTSVDHSLENFRQSAVNASNSKSRTRAYIQRLLNQQQKYTPTNFCVSATADLFTPEFSEDQVHVALVKIRQVNSIDGETLQGIGRTLVQLKKLGLISAIVIDSADLDYCEGGFLGSNRGLHDQGERVVAAIEQYKGYARIIDGTFSVLAHQDEEAWHQDCNSDERVAVTLPNLLITPLSRGIIPIILPIAYDDQQRAAVVKADSIVLALTRLLSIDHAPSDSSIDHAPSDSHPEKDSLLLSLHRIIFLDPLGGIPSRDRPNNTAHVFLNLEQEFEVVKEELRAPLNSAIVPSSSSADNIHIQNLVTLRAALALLPPTSSALITTPHTAATSASASSSSNRTPSGLAPNKSPALNAPTKSLAAGRNPLIYNLITDRPVFSSSLPINDSIPCTNTTLLKHGIPLSIYTNPHPDSVGNHNSFFTLKDGTVDLDKLIYLIEDSFGRTVNVDAYLSRINNRMAGLIIAGDYEGAAIITWEHGDASESESQRKKVPYLDKFAVLRRSQGAGGVADVIFKAMVIGLYPDGIVWRSRKNNPVNKWYFERAKGSWELPETIWTMFWTGDGDPLDRVKFEEYVDICTNIEPSFKN